MDKPFPLDFLPGVQRDGTRFDAQRYLDCLWTRWRLGRPRKIHGYQQITDALAGLPRKVHCFYTGSQIIAHIGTARGIQQVIFDSSGNLISVTDRTPSQFQGGVNVGWTIDAIFDTTSGVVQLVAQSVPDQTNLASADQTVPYLGSITGNGPLVQFSNPGTLSSGTWTQPKISGGIACVQPFVFDFDNSGLVGWSAPNLPLYLGVTGGGTGAGQARVSAQKVVQIMALRGGGAQQPAAVIWTLSEVIIASYVGTPAWFAFSTVSPSSSILSQNGVIEYDGLYFWAGVDRFLVFNGTVAEVPNQQNQDWFFDNLTPGYETQVFATKVPRYGEIWWCAPMFGSTVPNYAIIYNLRENCWYDTALPDGGRSAGYFAQGFLRPVMAGSVAGPNGYSLWMHEEGVDKNVGGTLSPIRSYYETGWFGGPKLQQPTDQGYSFTQMEPDFVQTGDMNVWLIGAANARAADVAGPSVLLRQTPGIPQEQFVSYQQTIPSRLLRLHVESDTVGGYFIGGRSLGRGVLGDRRLIS